MGSPTPSWPVPSHLRLADSASATKPSQSPSSVLSIPANRTGVCRSFSDKLCERSSENMCARVCVWVWVLWTHDSTAPFGMPFSISLIFPFCKVGMKLGNSQNNQD